MLSPKMQELSDKILAFVNSRNGKGVSIMEIREHLGNLAGITDHGKKILVARLTNDLVAKGEILGNMERAVYWARDRKFPPRQIATMGRHLL